jgi:hypothetical protein
MSKVTITEEDGYLIFAIELTTEEEKYYEERVNFTTGTINL